ncbi:MAG: UDP-N-acetylmuramoylalanyl-D-glutamyl-2, 6-diaminopimelate/D-alanyl-D-alanyl ligase [Candidatus Scalindua rubra]|uniref:UDP-N-acetylmuramoylalanyl-D-glutamyl-2, 6-diaminopimelate/D-alanyl-D-alanyl ligase n=1 Tax=Candidatus Scalindua rubra TaxID=1872076 RepID=A0A1E3XCQ1_9BACT|nr:MAG: UDP-N-acetylmuramoylalanyl-D-glutamyl-2, 6-diaminopimelate/D-alanyl-D-alanyl ligase [Candidatus Scalindua rubra]
MDIIKVSDILKATSGKLIQGNSELNITGISTDTRSIKSGEIFFALEGKNYDGYEFVKQAIYKGAVGAVISSCKRVKSTSLNGSHKRLKKNET